MWGTNDDLFMARYSAFNPYRLRHRDMGFQPPIGSRDALAKSLYCGMKPISCWSCDDPNTPTGGIFNLEFSPDGSLLVAACERKTIQIFDPMTQQRIHCIVGAHQDCINCVKFLDSRMFATCSDDTTIAIWDIRNVKKKIRSLTGHSKWVKNIEYSQKDKLLVTSGLDGSIYTWAINAYSEYNNIVYQRVFHTSSLMRCRLTPDAKQMVLSTTGGLIMLIHDLNLSTLGVHLMGFKPNLYRLMQMSQQVIPLATKYNYLFDPNRRENRVEFISDFPGKNDAEVISSLQIHPHGWTALSRNISHDDKSEWTCIHDIQPSDPREKVKSTRDSSSSRKRARSSRRPRSSIPRRERAEARFALRRSPRFMHLAETVPTPVVRDRRLRRSQRFPVPASEGALEPPVGEEREVLPEEGDLDAPEPEAGPSRDLVIASVQAALTVPDRVAANADAAVSRLGRGSIQNDLWEASITIKQHRILQDIYRRGSVRRSFNMQRITGINTGLTPPPPTRSATESTMPSLSGMTPRRRSLVAAAAENTANIKQNRDRLLYYVEETNLGKGFIKELCYSSDGRIVCSPFGEGIRLLALDENCSEIPSVIQEWEGPTTMHEIGQSLGYHSDLVVCSKFNPRFHMLVSGCLEGKIVWYQPYSGEAS